MISGHRRPVTALLAAALVTLAACGNRLPHSEIVSSALGTGSVAPTAAGQTNPTGTAGSPTAGSPTAGTTPAAATPTTAATGSATANPTAGPTVNPAASGPGTGPATSPGSASGPANPTTATGSPVVIGNIGTYSGIIGALFASGQQMAYVWTKWVNAHGGLNGHPVTMITADDGGDPNKYLSEAEDMVQNHHVLAFMGNLVPLSANGAAQYLQQRGVPVVGGDSTSPIWFQNPDLFPDATDFPFFSLAAARQAVAAGKPKVAVIWCIEVPACHTWNSSLQGGDAAKEGAQIAYTGEVSLAQPDFTSDCLESQTHGAQAILAAVDAASLERLSSDCAAQGYHPLYVAVSLAVVNQVATDPDLQGLIAPQGTFPWPADDTPATQDYQQAIDLYAPGLQGSGASASVWTSGALLQQAGAHLPANPTSHDLLEALWAIKGDTLGGLAPPITYTQGQGATGSGCYFLVKIAGGKWVAPIGSRTQCIS